MRQKQPVTVGRAATAILAFPFQFLRTVLVLVMVAFARAFGGKPRIPNPEPRNIPGEVERKK
ncbi:MAG TPA: hypothetical protein VGK67_27185 [Myxococcales bacterium]|jgi:hypothetical protein